jgi:integrase
MNKGKTFITETLTRDEITDLIDALENSDGPRTTDISIARNLAGFMLLYRAGLRRKEVSDLHLKDIDFDAKVVHVLHGKGDKERRVSMDDRAFAYIERWIKHRGTEQGPLIQGFRKNGVVTGNRVHESYWNKLLFRLATKTGIGKRCNPHSLRHTMANELRQEGISTWTIMK